MPCSVDDHVCPQPRVLTIISDVPTCHDARLSNTISLGHSLPFFPSTFVLSQQILVFPYLCVQRIIIFVCVNRITSKLIFFKMSLFHFYMFIVFTSFFYKKKTKKLQLPDNFSSCREFADCPWLTFIQQYSLNITPI